MWMFFKEHIIIHPNLSCQLIVATNAVESQRLDGLYERGLKNNVPDLQLVGPDLIREIEPHCRVSD